VQALGGYQQEDGQRLGGDGRLLAQQQAEDGQRRHRYDVTQGCPAEGRRDEVQDDDPGDRRREQGQESPQRRGHPAAAGEREVE
jgi:hypothetical protein